MIPFPSSRSRTSRPRSGRGVGAGAESCRVGGRAESRTRAQSWGAPCLHRCLSGDGICLHVAGGPDWQLAPTHRRWSVFRTQMHRHGFWNDEILSVLCFFCLFFCTDPEAARAASSKITTTLGLVVHAAGEWTESKQILQGILCCVGLYNSEVLHAS